MANSINLIMIFITFVFFSSLSIAGEYIDALKEKAVKGDTEAQRDLAWYYFSGDNDDIQKDYAEAAKWYRLAAEQGDAYAQCQLGNLYKNCQGVPRNYEEAAKWYKKSSEKGVVEAQFNLGSLYLNGNGVAKNYAEAFKFFNEAATDARYDEAKYLLGKMYEDGIGVKQNNTEAIKWYVLAAHHWNVNALFRLGCLYFNGKDVNQDFVSAYSYLALSAVLDHQDARKNLSCLILKMNPKQIAEGQKNTAVLWNEIKNTYLSSFIDDYADEETLDSKLFHFEEDTGCKDAELIPLRGFCRGIQLDDAMNKRQIYLAESLKSTFHPNLVKESQENWNKYLLACQRRREDASNQAI